MRNAINTAEAPPLAPPAAMPEPGTRQIDNLQPQEVILGLFGEYVQPGEKVWSGGLVQLMEDLGLSQAASRIALNRVVARGLLEPERAGKFVSYTISPRLERVHAEGRRQLFSNFINAPWHSEWTIVWYAIPEQRRLDRARFARWLNFRGFGALQDGARIAPGNRVEDVTPLLEQMGLEAFATIFVGQLGTPASLPNLIATVWDLDDLKRRYDLLADLFAAHRDPEILRTTPPRDAFIIRTRAIELFRQTVARDPKLPEPVMNRDWLRAEAIGAFHTLQQGLVTAAKQHFWDRVRRT